MAKEIQVHVWCDLHMLQGAEQVAGETTTPIAIGNAQPKTLDLCEPCRKELLDTLVQLLQDEGADASSTAAPKPQRRQPGRSRGVNATPGPFDCEVPDCGGRLTVRNGGEGYGTLGALKSHMYHAHRDLGFGGYVERYGKPQPMGAGQQAAAPEPAIFEWGAAPQDGPQPPVLPDPGPDFLCGIDGCERTFGHMQKPPQALGIHRARLHGIKGVKSRPAGSGR